jgi:hypothetical protein
LNLGIHDVGSLPLTGGGVTLANGRIKAMNAHAKINAINEGANDLDQSEEEILTYEVSDEAMEAAAGKVGDARHSFPETNDLERKCCPR